MYIYIYFISGIYSNLHFSTNTIVYNISLDSSQSASGVLFYCSRRNEKGFVLFIILTLLSVQILFKGVILSKASSLSIII